MFIAIDIGGTKTEIASFNTLNPDSLINSLTFSTPASYTDCLGLIRLNLTALSAHQPLNGLGISYASRLNPDQTISKYNSDFDGHSLPHDLNPDFPTKIIIQNDAVCAALAQLAYGRLPPVRSFIHFILGTGFGGAYAYQTHADWQAIPLEPGWMIIQPGGLTHTRMSTKGLFECYLGGGQLAAQLNLPLDQIPNDHLIWRQVSNYLAMAIYNFSMLLEPGLFVFSGGLIQKRPFLLDQTQNNFANYPDLVPPPQLMLSPLTHNPSLLGALSLLQ